MSKQNTILIEVKCPMCEKVAAVTVFKTRDSYSSKDVFYCCEHLSVEDHYDTTVDRLSATVRYLPPYLKQTKQALDMTKASLVRTIKEKQQLVAACQALIDNVDLGEAMVLVNDDGEWVTGSLDAMNVAIAKAKGE